MQNAQHPITANDRASPHNANADRESARPAFWSKNDVHTIIRAWDKHTHLGLESQSSD